MVIRLGLRRELGRRSSQMSSSSDTPGVAGISLLVLLSSVEEDAERAGERGSSLSMSNASSMENAKAESVRRGEGLKWTSGWGIESGAKSNSKSFSDSSGMIWRGRGLVWVE